MKNNKTPSLIEWLKDNPSNSLNDFNETFGTEIEDSDLVGNYSNSSKKNHIKSILLTSSILLLCILLALSFDFKTNKLNFNNILIYKYKTQKTEIINLIEKAYLDLSNGTLMGNQNSASLPFYNTDFSSVFGIIFTPAITYSGMSIEPRNYKFINIDEKSAEIKYTLTLVKGKYVLKTLTIDMNLKRIGGQWKLDCQKFFPINDIPSINTRIKSSKNKKKDFHTNERIRLQEEHSLEQREAMKKLFSNSNSVSDSI